MALNPEHIREDFPILHTGEDATRWIYLDAAATAQKPRAVLDAMTAFYEQDNGGVHRGVHPLSERATAQYERARQRVQHEFHAAHADEIIFTKSGTEAINLVAHAWGTRLQPGETVAVSILEHHANIVPWQQLALRTGARLRWIDCNDDGFIEPERVEAALRDGSVRLLAITAQSNVIGVRPDLRAIVDLAHAAGACTLVDAAQAAAHLPLDVQEIGCDFLTCSGHKLYGPTGIGVLYGRREMLRDMPPFLGGGGMIRTVDTEGYTPEDPPMRFEAGTPPVAEAVGLAAALDWRAQWSWEDRTAHERILMEALHAALVSVPDLRILGPQKATDTWGCASFVLADMHPHDLTEILGRSGICLRAGHHCAQPLHRRLGVDASARASVCISTTREEIEALPAAIAEARIRLHR